MAVTDVKRGKILLAEPFMLDPNFKRSAVLLCEHSEEEGSVGFILNKPLDMRIDELIENFPEFDSEVMFGGPVQTDTIHYLHNVGELLDDSKRIADGVYWGGDFEKLKILINSGLVESKNIRFFVGYSGWSEGQLKEEMGDGSWVVTHMHANYLFKTQSWKVWQQAMQNMGNAYSVIAQMPDGQTWN